MADWSQYDDCPDCGQAPGKPCVDLRYRRYGQQFNTDRPHPRRPKQ